ncbi:MULTISPECIES: ATP-binding protein [unclassified Thalassospira]|uniref:ATP-binding protein n=1 Tax=unclassified Thalassospira TaxID=2648997 RepID=UPI0025D92079|nr:MULTISPECIES: ATP-binding protein [unclassified Thalassospira]|tara:strand:+ start:34199 stop:35062 length:864 start_codon:yes stop_codon:yes gene_type:complete
MTSDFDTLLPALERIANALERMAPPARSKNDLSAADAFVWQAQTSYLQPVRNVNRVDISLLQGIGQQKEILYNNTKRFADGLPANNALLWGARGTGKSSIVKAMHAMINAESPASLALVEIHREDIPTLPDLLHILQESGRRTVLFCDDLSFDMHDESYKSLKAVLDGGIEGRPKNVIFYATSNRRHLMARDMIENERSTAINPSEAVEEKVSLSDRFGLWLGFHNISQDVYFEIIDGYAKEFKLDMPTEELHARAKEWTVTRGSRSGRVAWQFIQEIAGELGKSID